MWKYKLLNKIFGWDYIQWRNPADQGIARVYRGFNGEVYYWRYKLTKLIDKIKKAEDVVWLTCEPNKFGL